MTNQTLASLLVLLLLLAGNGRFLFIRRPKRDTLATLPFFALIIAAVDVFVFGLSLETLAILILAAWSSLWNIRALIRLSSNLIIDRYSILLRLICTIDTILTVAVIGAIIYFRPPDYTGQAPKLPSDMRLPIEQDLTLYMRDGAGYKAIDRAFVFPSLRIARVSPVTPPEDGTQAVLFVPPETASTELYLPFFQKLASEGYDVYAAELYDDFDIKNVFPFLTRAFKRAAALGDAVFNRDEYEARVKERGRVKETFLALLDTADLSGADAIYLISDNDIEEAAESLLQSRGDEISGCYDISYVENYKSKGLGPIENTEPLLSFALYQTFDRSGYMASHLAMAVCSFVDSLSFSVRPPQSESGASGDASSETPAGQGGAS